MGALNPPEDLDLESAGVGGHVDVAAVLEPTHFGEFGTELVLGRILVLPVEVARKRTCFQLEA